MYYTNTSLQITKMDTVYIDININYLNENVCIIYLIVFQKTNILRASLERKITSGTLFYNIKLMDLRKYATYAVRTVN